MTARRKTPNPAPAAAAEGAVAPAGSEAAPAAGQEPSFENALERLEQIVEQLEQGDLELEASLAAFEEGVGLSRHCARQLEVAEQRVEVLVRESGEWLARPFDPPEGAPEDELEDDPEGV
ncbi:MAG: exodeoxyribonuclease VII small subunit [Myxococcota bacterium]